MTDLTIGMPLYNNSSSVERAINSLLAQTYRNFRLLISDDGSADETMDIVKRLASADSRVDVVRQPVNLNYGNFRFVVRSATTPFFMFAAGDDVWESTFVERCIELLDQNPAAVCAVSQVEFQAGDSRFRIWEGTRPLVGERAVNVAAYLRSPMDNSRMYGIFRTKVAQAAFPDDDHYAYDWTFSASTLLHGLHLEVEEVLMHRDKTPTNRYIEYVRRDNRRLFDRLFPLLPMTRSLLRQDDMPVNLQTVRSLLFINLQQHQVYANKYYPKYARVFNSLLGRLIHRL